jgi:hypothetical protein
MSRSRLGCPLALALIGSLLASSLARAQEPPRPPLPPPPLVAPPPPLVAPPPPLVAPPPPLVGPPPPVVVVGPGRPVAVYDEAREERRMHDRMMARVFTGVGSTVLILGFFSLMAGIPVLVLTATGDLCKPSSTHSCDGYYALSYGLIGGGVAGMVAGSALDIVGSVYRYRARFAKADLIGPRVALLPSADGRIGGAAVAFAIRF